MLASRSAKALHEKALLKLHGMRKLPGSPSFGGTLFLSMAELSSLRKAAEICLIFSKIKARMQNYTRYDAQSFYDAMIFNMDSLGKYMLELILHQQRTPQLLKQKKLMQTQEDHSNPILALNVDSLKVDLVVIQNTCSEKEDSNVKKSIAERTCHQRQYERRVNKRQMQTQESKIDTSKALDNGLVVMESNGTESDVQDDNSRSGNDTDADDADIRPIYDEEPMAELLVGDLQILMNQACDNWISILFRVMRTSKRWVKSDTYVLEDLCFELETHVRRFFESYLITGLDDGVAASFQRSWIHKPHAHTHAFKVNHSTSR
ncbi:hypothetical protein Tco_0264733 [Tanacetum coccineum]